MKKFPSLSKDAKNELLEGIVKDAIIFNWLYAPMDTLQETIDPRGKFTYSLGHYSGLFNAFLLIGYPLPKTFEEEERFEFAVNELWNVFSKAVEKNNMKKNRHRKDVEGLAKKIIKKWDKLLKNK